MKESQLAILQKLHNTNKGLEMYYEFICNQMDIIRLNKKEYEDKSFIYKTIHHNLCRKNSDQLCVTLECSLNFLDMLDNDTWEIDCDKYEKYLIHEMNNCLSIIKEYDKYTWYQKLFYIDFIRYKYLRAKHEYEQFDTCFCNFRRCRAIIDGNTSYDFKTKENENGRSNNKQNK